MGGRQPTGGERQHPTEQISQEKEHLLLGHRHSLRHHGHQITAGQRCVIVYFLLNSITKYIPEYFYFTQLQYQLNQ